jgi:myo-inositol 2-dehydrogenase/D-chiro-inositol 1-dehydrogenase/scyllo-inositol 2-dehydrogenase (NAD+)
MKPVVRFCLIGAGRAGYIHAVNLAGKIKSAQLVAVCDSSEEAARRIASELNVARVHTDFNEAVSQADIDAVVVVTPTFLHCRIACAAAENGKHVFLEKPMAITSQECEEINAAVAKSGVSLQIGFMRRFDQGFLRAKEVVDSGGIGRIVIIKSTGRGPGLPPPWIYDIEKSNGILAEVNSHDFDTIRWLVGSEFHRVYAEAGNFKCPEAREAWPQFYDNAVVNMRLTNGAIGVVDGTCPAHYGYDARVEILGEKGML